MSGPTKTNTVTWFEIYVDDMSRAKKFYEGVFAQTLRSLSVPSQENDDASNAEMWTFDEGRMDTYGTTGALVKMDGMSAGGNSVLVYFGCEDCALEQSRVEEFGGAIVQAKFPIGEFGFCALVADSEGNTIGLHSLQ